MRATLAAGCVLAVLVASPAGATTFDVAVSDGFAPAGLSVEAGDSVRWTNTTPAPAPDPRRPPRILTRQVISMESLFAPQTLAPGESFTFTFEQPGFFWFTRGGNTRRAWIRVKPPTLSLAAADDVVTFGAGTHVTGVVSTKRAGEHVTLLQRTSREADSTAVAEVTTGEGGTYDVVVTPTIPTIYKAAYRGVESREAFVGVRPSVKLTPGGRGTFLVRVGGASVLAGGSVFLQRRRLDGIWADVASARLTAALTASFRIPRVRGVVRYRAFMPWTSGFSESWSGTQTVRRR